MSLEGVWKVEILGPYGMEPLSTAFLQNGRYLAASADHYSVGSYELDGDDFRASIRTTQHGKIRAVFGSRKEQFDIRIEGDVRKDGTIVGRGYLAAGRSSDISVHLTRLEGLD